MNTALAPAPPARCGRCRGTEHLIEGDEYVVCRPCLLLLGAVVNDPRLASERLREALIELHADVVVLVTMPSGPMWSWIADWPA